MRNHVHVGLWLAVVLGWALLMGGCGGGRLISQDQEVSMGQQAGDQFEAKYGLDKDPAVTAAVQALAQRITAAAKPPDYPYDVRVLNSTEVNACAFPGGRIYLFRGLIETFNRDADPLAWVVAHEAAHVARRHTTKRIEQQLGYEAAIALVFNRGDAPQIAGAVASLMLLSYSRQEESEADRYGLVYAHAAGYDPTAAVRVLQKFQEIQGRDPNDFEIMFDTHPGNTQRLDGVKSYLKSQGWQGRYYQY